MSLFKEKTFADRLSTSTEAKRAMLEKFRARQPKLDDPAVQERMAAQVALARARETRIAEKKAQREAERLAHEAEVARLAEEKAAQEAAEKRAAGDRAIAELAEQKAARDARYAARKARTGKKK
jgi:hypothetical protein